MQHFTNPNAPTHAAAASPLTAGAVANLGASSPVADSHPRGVTGVVRTLRALVREHASIFALLLAYLAVAFTIDAAFPTRDIVHLHVYDELFFLMLEIYTIVFLLGFSLREATRVPNGRSAVVWIWNALRSRYLTLERAGAFVMMIVYARVLTDTFVSLKAAIPLLQPFAWDATLMRVDRALHGGHDPWTLLQPFATPLITTAISFVYNLWIFVLFAMFIWQAWSARRLLRKRFFLTFGLAWMLLGGIVATTLSSAGPCYFARVTHTQTDPYAPLTAYLRAVDEQHRVWALGVQEALWDAYLADAGWAGAPRNHAGGIVTDARGVDAPSRDVAGAVQDMRAVGASPGDGSAGADDSVKHMLNGISAMPSMHVAMSVLFALVGWKVRRWLGAVLALYALTIQIGSVHLGWHYAVDGYVSAVAMLVLWTMVGRFLDRQGATLSS